MDVLRVDVGNVRNDRGLVHVDICTRADFLKDCPVSVSAPARRGVTQIEIPNLPPGEYAAQAYHDENGNDKVDQGLFGIPREGVGFSNDAKIRLGPPRYRDAAFRFDGGRRMISIHLRYFMGR